jgi:hypothetical protein
MAFVEYEGDFTNFSGELLAGWFIANPNGPTAGALGLVEVGRTRKLFYRWMHFTGGKTWLSSDLTTYLASNDDFGEIVLNELISIGNDAIVTGKDVKLLLSIPSVLVLNDNPQIRTALSAFIQVSLGDKDWGRELYYLTKYGPHLFSRYEEEYRDIYERLKGDPSANPEFLRNFWLANKHRQGFQHWEPNKYRSSSLTPDIFKVWYERVTDPDFVARATFCCAQMWVGASATAEQTGRIAQLKGAGRYQGLNEVLTFFERINCISRNSI